MEDWTHRDLYHVCMDGTVPYCCDPTNGYHGQVEWEEVTHGEEAREDMQAAHVDAAVQGQQDKQAACIQGNLHSPPCNLLRWFAFLEQKFAVTLATSILREIN